jgi:exopolyphosphatase/guanosine-5'-triphosphate,3'-diphosphate pyrophosphatase
LRQQYRPEADWPDRAVIDIGSNTVRLVVYSGPSRAPRTWFNEKVVAMLGRDLGTTGKIPKEAADLALEGLARFATIVTDLGLTDVQVVATAAAREAKNGEQFLDKVRALGLNVRLLTGEEEAQTAAAGVIGAFPGAHGVVADLGGGSLELVSIEKGQCHHGTSLPLGTLRLPKLRQKGMRGFNRAVEKALARAGWASEHPGPLYLVGGTWRAFAAYALKRQKHPLSDPHALSLDIATADKYAKRLARSEPGDLIAMGIPELRASSLPDAAAMLRIMLADLKPSALVVSSWGLREGLLFQKLSPAARNQDPLLAGIAHFAVPRGASITRAATIAGWTVEAANGDGNGSERLRLAATVLALAASQLEPNMRWRHAIDWALHKRWVGLDMPGRAQIAAALCGSFGKTDLPGDLRALATEAQLREAVAWGLAARLCRRVGAGAQISLLASRLERDRKRLVLTVDESRAALATDRVKGELAVLAGWLGLDHQLRIGSVPMTR